TYLVGENIDLELEIKNVNNSLIKENFGGSVNIYIYNQNGKEIDQRLSGNHFSPDQIEFKNNEESFKCIQLNDFFW
ncbi:hypothetical protein, partial [Clostridium sp.]|uniref:hypothetical protein n=1 Tax=Clostridium sp. TaxID=1506 RepID=UPI00284DDB43